MSTYKRLHGKSIKSYASDPENAVAGDMWYNSTSQTLKGIMASGAWSSASSMTTGREYGGSGIGTLSANLVAGGYVYNPGRSSLTEEYNGLGWTAIANTTTNKYLAGGAGTTTAALVFGGSGVPPFDARTEEYNGTSWSEQDDMSSARSLYNAGAGGPGGQTAGLAAGGYGGSNTNSTEEYGGTSWTGGGNLGTARRASWLCGTQTAAMLATGYISGASTTVENYDGSSWTSGTTTNVARSSCSGSAMSQDSALIFGGNDGSNPAGLTTAEEWNGTSWVATPSMAVGRSGINGAGSATGAIAASGFSTPPDSSPTVTEEYNFTAATVVPAAWSSGGAYPTAILQLGGAGTQTAGLGFGGNGGGGNPNGSVISAEYNGSSWTSSGDLNQKGNTGSRTGVGTQTAALCVARRNDGTPSVSPVSYIAMNNVEEYNGSAWSNSPTLPAATVESGSTGTTVAALYFGGSPGNPPAGLSGQSLYWNDTSWTATPSLNTSRAGIMSAFQGTYNASLGFGGSTGAPAYGVTNTELYNGSSWTNLAVMLEQKNRGSGHGTSTAALAAAGQNPSTTTNTQIWNGTSWATNASTATAQYFQGGGGSSTAAVIFAGADPSAYTTATQEFTGETTTANIKEFTTS